MAVWESCTTGSLEETFKVHKRCARIRLEAPFQAISGTWMATHESNLYSTKTTTVQKKSWMNEHRTTGETVTFEIPQVS